MDNLIRIGNVTAINKEKMQVRVHFPDDDFISDWLSVLKHKSSVSSTGKASGGTGESAFAEHSHTVYLGAWMPEIGDAVLCVYLSGFNADGYVLGGL
jgi:phage baseplate assembly protein gpV